MGLIEKRGTGIKLMQDTMHDFGLRPPLFEEGPQWFKVTLSKTRSDMSITSDHYEERIMELFETESEIANSDVCKLIDVSKATAVALLGKLIAKGKIVREGRGPRTRYLPA